MTKVMHFINGKLFPNSTNRSGNVFDPALGKVVREVSLAEIADAQAAICLLYTSPSPRDRTRSRMPSSA